MHRHIRRTRNYFSGDGLRPLLVRAVAGSGMVRIAAMLATFGVGVQLARGLGVEGYGYYGLALAVITIASIPSELGLSKLVLREVATAAAAKNYCALFGVLRWADRTCWSISAVAAAALAVAAVIILNTGSSPLGVAILLGIPTIPLLALSRIRGGALQGLYHIVRGQIPANLLRPLLLSLLLFGVYFAGFALTPASAMALNSVTAVVVFVVAHIWLRNRLPATSPPQFVHGGRKWLASSIPLALTDGMRTLQSELTILLLGLLTVAADVGLFRIAVVTATVAAAPIPVVVHATIATIARLHAEGKPAQLQKLVTYSAYAQTAGVILLSLPLLIVPELLLSIVFGSEYAPAANALRIVALGHIANAAFGSNIHLLNMTHHERRVTRAMGIALVLNVITVLLLAAQWGIIGAALGYVVSLLAWNVITWLDGRRILSIDTSVFAVILPSARSRDAD